MSAFKEYHVRLASHPPSAKTVALVKKIIRERQLTSVMNNTKWLELQAAISTLPFPPAFVDRYLTDMDEPPADVFGHVPQWLGDWSSYWEEGLPPFFMIEWIKVCPKLAKPRGRLLEDEIIDITAEFEAILIRLHIPYEKSEGIFTIWGYK